jgi:hypothetical protein
MLAIIRATSSFLLVLGTEYLFPELQKIWLTLPFGILQGYRLRYGFTVHIEFFLDG